ncbi:MAG: TIGR03905 family TSCPD domain-containing protein [Lachnospiraceae bacterium]|nr:TIGR03905 family TSCPD domain-containing protein [Lachnospiraceae bacterium]
MRNCKFTPKGVCSRLIEYELDEENRIHNLRFTGGCNGNLKAIGKLLEGESAEKTIRILKGNDCAGRGTSCADQLAVALEEELARS